MNKFVEYCRKLMETEHTNLYRFCAEHNLERTGIRRMLSGERLPKQELFQAFMNALTLTPGEQKNLLELYEEQKIGEERFENRIFIKNMLSYIGEIQEFQKKAPEIGRGDWQMPKGPAALVANHMEISCMIQQILRTEKKEIYTNIPMDCPDFFQLLQQEVGIRSHCAVLNHFLAVLKKSEIPYDVNYNLRLLKKILPFALQEETNYRPLYYYSNFQGRDSMALYPFYLLSESYLLLLGEDYRRGLLYTDPTVLDAYRQEIRRLADRATPLIFKPENSQIALEYYIQTCVEVSRPVYTLEYYPCIFQAYSEELFEPFLKERSPELLRNADLLAKSVAAYKPYDAFGSKEGFLKFARYGELSGPFLQVLHPFSREVRREILRRIAERCRQGLYRLHLVPEGFLSPFPRIGLELYENRTIALISCASLNSYSVLNEKTLYGAFEDYFSSILEHPEVSSAEETARFLDELQKELA